MFQANESGKLCFVFADILLHIGPTHLILWDIKTRFQRNFISWHRQDQVGVKFGLGSAQVQVKFWVEFGFR